MFFFTAGVFVYQVPTNFHTITLLFTLPVLIIHPHLLPHHVLHWSYACYTSNFLQTLISCYISQCISPYPSQQSHFSYAYFGTIFFLGPTFNIPIYKS